MLKENLKDDSSWYYSYADQSSQSTYSLPFVPGFSNGGNLDTNTISLNATHAQGKETQYNFHNLNGLIQTEYTYSYLTQDKNYNNSDNRPFISSQSTFSSSGRYGSHNLPPNKADWSYLNYSIAGIMNMNMFGIPHSGADICGTSTTDAQVN